MARSLSVLLLSQSSSRLNALEDTLFDQEGINSSRKLLAANQSSPMSDVTSIPEVVVLDLGKDWESDLLGVANDPSHSVRMPLIVIGPNDDPAIMRRSMQVGARDYFSSPISEEELISSIRQIGRENQLAQRHNAGTLTSIINGKGGSGATLLATNLATLALGRDKKNPVSCVLADFDLQFGDVPVYLDLESNDNLMQAIGSADNLDLMALDGFLQTHGAGLHVLASKPEELRSLVGLNTAHVASLLSTLSRHHDHVVLDLPRVMDPAVVTALENSDQILLVTQQSVPHIRDTKYLLGLLRGLGISQKSIKLVINRFDKRSEVKLADIQDVFPDIEHFLVPEDLKRVNYSINNGVPVVTRWPKSPLAKSLLKMKDTLWPKVGSDKNRR